MNPLSKTPFLSLLVPLIAGILIQYYLHIETFCILFFLMGAGFMLLSYFVVKNKYFNLRWLFGIGLFLFTMGIGIVSTRNRQIESENIFDTQQHTYKGIIIDIPQDKQRSIAYKVVLPDYGKKIVCYFQLDSTKTDLRPGDEFLFRAAIQPFKNAGNPDDFDYVTYMYNQGYAGSAYVSAASWMTTGKTSSSPEIVAQRYRQKILDFYKSLGFDDTEYAIISALTIGYQNALSDDIKQAFRTTGTVHVLSVSGLHVGIIYLMIASLLGFIKKTSRFYRIKPALIILLLWIYAFLAGLSPSVTRASLMLSMFCLSELFGRRSYSVHAMYIAAFLLLLYNPFSFFNIGFQLSFLSVAGILYLQPKVSGLLKLRNKIGRRVWESFTLSCVAQLATFPLCLYYFGTFPTYFFITNLIIVPLVTLITEFFGLIILAKGLSMLLPSIADYLFYLPLKIVQLLLWLLTKSVHFFESLPFALIQDIDMSFSGLLLLVSFILMSLAFFLHRKTAYLKASLCIIVVSFISGINNNIKTEPDSLIVYNRKNGTEIRWQINNKYYILTEKDLLSGYKLLDINSKRILVLSKNSLQDKHSSEKFKIDYLLLTGDGSVSLNNINEYFSFDNLILDSSLSKKQARALVKECQKLYIQYYDVGQNGAYRIIF